MRIFYHKVIFLFFALNLLLTTSVIAAINNPNQIALQNTSPTLPNNLNMTSSMLGWNSPLTLGVNYDKLAGTFMNAKYAFMFNPGFGISVLGEYGKDIYRVGATLGTRLSPQTLAKVSIERLDERLPFAFTTGTVNQRVGQDAVGANIEYMMSSYFFRKINFGGYFAKSESVSLNSIYFVSNAQNCGGQPGLNCVDMRNIAGANASGGNMGATWRPLPATLIDGSAYFDDVRYNTINSSESNNKGFGASLKIDQLITDSLRVYGGAEIRKIYDIYNAGFAWLPPVTSALNLELMLNGQKLISHTNVPDSDTISLSVTFDLNGTKGRVHYGLGDPSASDLESWIREPAVYMSRVLSIVDEKIVLLSTTAGGPNPNFGPISGGNIVTFMGSNFIEGTLIYFGNRIATIISLSPTQIIVYAPPGSAGAVDITIEPPNQPRIVQTNAYTYVNPLAPGIQGVSPNSGPITGNTVTFISGTNLTGTTSVTFGGIPGTNLTVINNNLLMVTTPAHPAGAVDVVVTTPEGTATLSNGFTYQNAPTIGSITPSSGSIAGGTNVTINGTNLLGTSSITFDGIPATNITVVNGTTVTATTPAHAAGVVTVSVTTTVGSANLINGYTYTVAPILDTISPSTGLVSGGTSVTLTGANLTGTTSVTFDGIPATNVTVVNDNTVTAVTPSHSAGTVSVTLTTPSGSASLNFTYTNPPTLGSVSPAIGSTAGGTAVTLSGTNLTGTTGVTFGGIPATNVTVVNDSTVTAVTPANTAGTVDVTITTPVGSATLNNGYTYISAPNLTSISPTSGGVAGGTAVTLSGTSLTGTTSVTFGGIPATNVVVVNDSTVTAVTPAHAAGSVDITLMTPAGSSTLVDGYTYLSSPTLSSISPTSGPTGGGQTATLTGTNLSTTTGVAFGGTPATNVSVVNSTTVTATTPAHAAGVVDVAITTTVGSATLTNGYTYNTGPLLNSISPTSGPLGGGTLVTLSGSNLTGTTSVTLDGIAATNVTVVNDNTVTAITPAHAAGIVDVVLTTPSGSSTLTNGFTYQASPTLTNVSPNSGTIAGGTNVTLTGTGFIGTTGVTFDGAPATNVVVVNSTTITATTPAHAAGAVNVAVTTPSGSASLVNGYTYNVAPTVNSVSPPNGPLAGGTTVTLTGTNFTGTTGVTFDGLAATNVTVINDTTVTATTPAHAAGSVNVTLTTPAGSGTLTNGYTYVNPPSLTSISPTIGTVAGGTAVTLTGNNLTGTTSVILGGVAATNVTVVNNSTVTAVTPAHAAGTVNVTVGTPGGSATLVNGYTYAAAPILTSIQPNIGTVAGGTNVTLTGSNLTGTTGITFGGVAATNIIVVNDSTVTATTPAHAAGAVDVVLTTPVGSATLTNGYTYANSPNLISVSPTIGTVAGGTSVTLTGTSLTGTTSVTFGGTAATNVTVVNDSTVTAVTPAHAAGTVNVALTTPIGSSTLVNGYTYAVAPSLTSINPDNGSIDGGTSITLTGANLTGTTSVTIGGTAATNVTVVNSTTVTAVTAAHAQGTFNVVLTTPAGSATLTDGYTYLAVPTLTSCKYTSLTIFNCVGTNLNVTTPFLNIQGGLNCGLATGIVPLVTNLLTLTQIGGVTLPLLYTGCQVSLCTNNTCTGVQSNIIPFQGLFFKNNKPAYPYSPIHK